VVHNELRFPATTWRLSDDHLTFQGIVVSAPRVATDQNDRDYSSHVVGRRFRAGQPARRAVHVGSYGPAQPRRRTVASTGVVTADVVFQQQG
jgi:hypothetical protein